MSNNEIKEEIKEEVPETLKIDVHEKMNITDVPPGGRPNSMKEIEESLPKDEIEKRQKIMLEYTRLSSRYCEPHNNKSAWVKKEDIARVMSDGQDLVAMCNLPRGKYSGIAALAHSQIDSKTPLRFFVLPNGMVVINPVITKHTKAEVEKNEGCMSYPDEEIKQRVARYNKCTVVYQTLAKEDGSDEPSISEPIEEALSGSMAHVFQHECGHLNGCNIYDADYSPEKSIGLGDGKEIEGNPWGLEPAAKLEAVISNLTKK